ncbi:uncharacterized protein LOC112453480, partial [Temnothorax curvispinosus]|uniref:Uncharacterized protein LOC112453480 n=1 Tax=Temnothorax curvispinosus TaxID=300111 RepID=A0A6J1PK75_9HYME
VQNNSPECLHAEDSLGSRRIVNLKVFGQQLWCLSCNIALSINNAVSEKNFGLASIFKVKCSQCGRLRTVNTDDKLPGNEGFIVNTKAAFGMIDAGIGPTHLNTFLTSIDLPSIAPKSLKIHERRIGKAIEEVAKESCLKGIQLEKNLTVNESQDVLLDALTAVVPHSFGQHDFCGDWCRSQDAGEKYQHNNLPNGKPLSDSALRLSLTQIFNRYIDCAEKLAECGSSQENESMNNIVASKTPKARHYAASESLSFRIGASICQKNLGSSYANDVFRKLELSPGKKSVKYRTAKDEKRTRKVATSVRREGVAYQSGIAMHDFTQMQNIQNLTEITDFSQCNIVVFDLETAGFAKSDEILQIAAYVENETFSVYISPTQLISKTATAVTGLHAMSGELYLHGTKMISTSATDAVNQFISFLRKYDQCLLIAHNCFKFDAPRLIKLIEKVGLMQAFSSCVKGFADSLEISKCVLPERVKEKQKFSIASLAQDFLPSFDVQNLHNAIED